MSENAKPVSEAPLTPADVQRHSADLIAFYGEPISTFTRADAIAAQMFVDITGTPLWERYRFNYPVHISAALYGQAVQWAPEDSAAQGFGSQDDRLSELLHMFSMARRLSAQPGDRFLRFPLHAVARDGHSRHPQTFHVLTEVGPGDRAEPIITFWLADESRD